MKIDNFLAELKRRNVYKVAVAYIVAGWALSQGITQVFPVFDVPNWAIRLIVILIIIGFPVAVVLAWAFEITPEGIKRTEDVDVTQPHSVGGAWIYIVLVGAFVSIGLFFLGGSQGHRPQLFVSFQRQERGIQNDRREIGCEHASGRHCAKAGRQGANCCGTH